MVVLLEEKMVLIKAKIEASLGMKNVGTEGEKKKQERVGKIEEETLQDDLNKDLQEPNKKKIKLDK